MSTINDATTGTVRTSRNLRGLYDHARRVARRMARPLCASVRRAEVVPLRGANYRGHVTIHYADDSVGQALFNDFSIAVRWAETFALKRGGTFVLVP